jgi:type II secretory pathway pseudopilin PulG
MNRRRRRCAAQSGFTLLETLIVVALLMVIMGAIFLQISDAQQRSSVEQARLDLFQESREFVDQLTRDLGDAGYPNSRNFAYGQLSSKLNDLNTSVGLVKVDNNMLQFESYQPNGTGGLEVHSIKYELVNTGSGWSLQRSEIAKVNGSPTTQLATSTPVLEVDNVLNGVSGTPIFQYFDNSGGAVAPGSLPLAINDADNGLALSNITSIAITLEVQSPYVDIKTQQKPVMTLVSAVRMHNCAAVDTAGAVSCQNPNY